MNKFKLIKNCDTCCDVCGEWASNLHGPLKRTQKASEKFLIRMGWKVVDEEVLCYKCVERCLRK